MSVQLVEVTDTAALEQHEQVLVIEEPAKKGPAVLDNIRRLSEARAAAAVDSQLRIDTLAFVPGPLSVGASGAVYGDGDTATEETRIMIPAGRWGVVPTADHRTGLWHEHGFARIEQSAMSDLASIAGFPLQYINKLPRALATECVNYSAHRLADRIDNTFRLSTLDMSCSRPDWRVRAIVSNRYQPIEDAMLFDVLAEALGELPDARLHEIRLDDTFTRVTLKMHEVDLGDSAGSVGIAITNSETGGAAVHIDAWVLKLVCVNGLVAQRGSGHFTFRHVGSQQRDNAKALELKRNNILNAVYAAVEHSEQVAKDYRATQTMPLKDATQELRSFVLRESFSQTVLADMVKSWDERPVHSVAGVVDAITAYARKQVSPVQRQRFEVVAGNYLHRALHAAAS